MQRRFFSRVDAIALFDYPLTGPVHWFKYDGRAGWAHIFGRLVIGWLQAHAAEMADIDLIVGNPTESGRTPIRHVEEIMRAAHAEDTLSRWPITDPDHPVLIKTRKTKRSANGAWSEKLQAAREHAQALRIRHSLEGQKILLIDDVFTTGATFHTVGKRLIEGAGATEVRGLVLGRVPYRR